MIPPPLLPSNTFLFDHKMKTPGVTATTNWERSEVCRTLLFCLVEGLEAEGGREGSLPDLVRGHVALNSC